MTWTSAEPVSAEKEFSKMVIMNFFVYLWKNIITYYCNFPCLELSMLFGKTFYGLVSPIGQKLIRLIFLYWSSNFHSYLQTLWCNSSNVSTREILIFHNTFGLLYPALSAVGWILQFPFLSFLADSQESLWHGPVPQFGSFGTQWQSPCKYKHPTFQNQPYIFSKKKKRVLK